MLQITQPILNSEGRLWAFPHRRKAVHSQHLTSTEIQSCLRASRGKQHTKLNIRERQKLLKTSVIVFCLQNGILFCSVNLVAMETKSNQHFSNIPKQHMGDFKRSGLRFKNGCVSVWSNRQDDVSGPSWRTQRLPRWVSISISSKTK